jgi:ABC-type oligopeptide transport system substrate-binding subunit
MRLMIDDAAVAPLYNRVSYVLVKPRVQGLVVTGIDGALKGDYHFASVWIAED